MPGILALRKLRQEDNEYEARPRWKEKESGKGKKRGKREKQTSRQTDRGRSRETERLKKPWAAH